MDTIDFSKITNWPRLNPKKQAFCVAYLRLKVGATAAIEAGYAAKTAAKTACLLLKEPVVAGIIKQLQAEIWNNEALTIEEAKALLSQKARCSIGEVLNEDGEIDVAKVRTHKHVKKFSKEVTEVGTNRKVEMADSLAAIAQYSKLAGWLDKKESNSHDVGGVTVTVNWGGSK